MKFDVQLWYLKRSILPLDKMSDHMKVDGALQEEMIGNRGL
jgi:hypothetical protein